MSRGDIPVPGDFGERIDVLQQLVGDGDLVAENVVDQVYANFQHNDGRDDPRPMKRPFTHPRGGIANYLGSQVEGFGHREIVGWVEDAFAERRSCAEGARDTVDEFIRGVQNLAPRKEGNLRRSGAGKVIDGGVIAYDRPPEVPRLSEAELKAIRRRQGPSRNVGSAKYRRRKGW